MKRKNHCEPSSFHSFCKWEKYLLSYLYAWKSSDNSVFVKYSYPRNLLASTHTKSWTHLTILNIDKILSAWLEKAILFVRQVADGWMVNKHAVLKMVKVSHFNLQLWSKFVAESSGMEWYGWVLWKVNNLIQTEWVDNIVSESEVKMRFLAYSQSIMRIEFSSKWYGKWLISSSTWRQRSSGAHWQKLKHKEECILCIQWWTRWAMIIIICGIPLRRQCIARSILPLKSSSFADAEFRASQWVWIFDQ